MVGREEYLNNLTDIERTYYEYHGKLDDGNHTVDLYEELSIEGRLVV